MSLFIDGVHARMILDCRGYPTLQVDVSCGDVTGRADVPAGRSTGSNEVVDRRDGGHAWCDVDRYHSNPAASQCDRLLARPTTDLDDAVARLEAVGQAC